MNWSVKGAGAGSDFLGMVGPSENWPRRIWPHLESCWANQIRQRCFEFVIGIGGSYLGAKAVQSTSWTTTLLTCKQKEERKSSTNPLRRKLNLISTYLADSVEYVADKDFSVNVISKSGTTTEYADLSTCLQELLNKNTRGQEEANKHYLCNNLDL